MKDGGKTEEVESQIKVEVVDAGSAGASAVGLHVGLFGRQPERRQISTHQPRQSVARHAPGHEVIAKIRQWVSECGQLPVEHRQHARLGRMEDHVVGTEVAVHQSGIVAGRNVRLQPVQQAVHVRYAASCRVITVLTTPARQLSGKVITGFAEIGEACCGRRNAMQLRERSVHGIADGRTPFAGHLGQARVPENAPFHMVHHIERRADNARVFAQRHGARHGKALSAQRGNDTVFAVDSMRTGQQLAGRLLAQHEVAAVHRDGVSGVALAAAELAQFQRTGFGEFGHVRSQPLQQGHSV